MRDYAEVRGRRASSTRRRRTARCAGWTSTSSGSTTWTRACCARIIEKFEGGPVGISTIAAAVGEDAGTIEEVYEPFLVQHGFLQRTPRGRMATTQAYKHFGYTPPTSADQATLFGG